MTYGDAIKWCIQRGAVMRFVTQDSRPQFVITATKPSGVAVEMAIDQDGKTIVAHYPLDLNTEPSRAVAKAVIGCVEYFIERKTQVLASVN